MLAPAEINLSRTSGSSTDVSTPSAQWQAMREDREMILDLIGGVTAMRNAGQRWLPREPAESAANYQVRLQRSSFFPALRHTVDQIVAAIFENDIDTSKVNPAIRQFMDDVDLQGNNLTVFARSMAREAVAMGLGFVYVTMPSLAPGATLADAQAQQARPYWVQVRPLDVVSWRATDGRTLQRVRMVETEPAPVNVWDDSTAVQQIRVVEPGRYSIWRKAADIGGPASQQSGWIVASSGTMDIDEVPLVPIYTNRTGFMTARSPLIDLAHLNITHWQSSSDQRNILKVARVPFLMGSGFTEQEMGGDFVLSASRILISSNPDAKMGFVEHGGASILAGERDLANLEEQMRAIGAKALDTKQTPGDPTATAKSIDSSESSISVMEIAATMQDGLNNALRVMAKWVGEKDGGSIEIKVDSALDKMAASQKMLTESQQIPGAGDQKKDPAQA